MTVTATIDEFEYIKIMTWARSLRLKIGGEAESQIRLFCWIRSRPELAPYAMSIPNDRTCTRIMGAILKYMGLKPGASDCFIAIPKGEWHGLWIEMKFGKNKATAHQIKFQSDMDAKGYKAIICYSYEAARAAIEEYIALECVV